MNKKIISLALISIMILISLSTVLAAPYDLIHKTDISKNHSFTEFVDSPTVFDEVGADVENYLIEAEDGKLYNVEEVSAKVNEGKSFNEAVAELEPIEKPEEPSAEGWELVLEANKYEIQQNEFGTAGVEITAKVMKDGKVVDDIQDMGVVNFVSTLPNLTQVQSTLEKGETTINFIPIQVQETMKIKIRGTVANAPYPNEDLNTKTDEIVITVNPLDPIGGEITKHRVAAVNATMADRITLYFNNEHEMGKLKTSDFTVWNRSNPGEPINVKGFMRHPSNVNAIIAILDVDPPNIAMHDNTRHVLDVTDDYFYGEEIKFDLEDTEHLAAISAAGSDQLTVKITFSEPVLDSTKVTGPDIKYRANDPAKYSIDGIRVDNIPGATVTVGRTTVAGSEVTKDERHIVTIKLPVGYALAGGSHVLQISNVGEYASTTDSSNRLITQTLNFKTTPDDSEPEAYLTQHSPEQYLVTFNKVLSVPPTFTHIQNATKKAGAGDNQLELIQDNIAPYDDETYTVTQIPEKRANELKDPDYPKAVGPGYLIELNQDWTVNYNTKVTNVNYWNSTVNPYTLRIDDIEDLFGKAPITNNVNGRQEIKFNIVRDSKGPILEDGVKLPGYTYMVDDLANQVWMVESNEPIQIPHDVSQAFMVPAETPSQAQTDARPGDPVPMPEIEFTKGDKQIQGAVVWLSDADFEFNIQPLIALDEVGIWTVTIAAITDDVGNSQDTKIFEVEVLGTVVDKKPTIDWADAHWDIPASHPLHDRDNDWVHVKFNKDMSISGNESVLRTQNWTIQGYDLPIGSDIVLGIPFVEGTEYDAITIKLPKDWIKNRTGGDLTLNYRDLKDTEDKILGAGRVILDEKTPSYTYAGDDALGAEYTRTVLITIPEHMPAGDFDKLSPVYTLKNAYIYGHGAVLNSAEKLTVGSGANQNATIRDITVQDMDIDVGTGSVTLINITVNGTLNIISGGVNTIYIKGGYINNLVITDTDGVRIVVTNDAGIGSFDVAGGDVTLDSSRDISIASLNIAAGNTVKMRSQSGALLTEGQVNQRVGLITGNGKLVGEEIIYEGVKISKEAEDVIRAINALPLANKISLDDEAAVIAAKNDYNALTAAQKAEVPAGVLQKLVAAEAKIAELKGGEPEIKATIVVKTPGVLPGMDLVEVTLTGVDNPEDYEIKFEGKVFKFENGVFTYVVKTGTTAEQLEITKKSAPEEPEKPEVTIVVKTPGVLPGMDLVEVTLTGVDNPEDYEVKFEGKTFKFENGVFTYVVKTGTTADKLEIAKK